MITLYYDPRDYPDKQSLKDLELAGRMIAQRRGYNLHFTKANTIIFNDELVQYLENVCSQFSKRPQRCDNDYVKFVLYFHDTETKYYELREGAGELMYCKRACDINRYADGERLLDLVRQHKNKWQDSRD